MKALYPFVKIAEPLIRQVYGWDELNKMFPDGYMAMVTRKEIDSWDEKTRFYLKLPGRPFADCVGDSPEETRLKMAVAGYAADERPSAFICNQGFGLPADYFFAVRRTG